MATKACTQCLRAIQRQSRPQSALTSKTLSRRTFAASTVRYQEKPLAETYAVTHEQPPVTPIRAQGGAQEQPSANEGALKGFVKLTRGTTNTYTAYGATEALYMECARQATYSIPQATTDEETPKTEDGEDLGVGEGWWVSELGLKPTFSTWSQVTMLHMYLLSARFRCFDAHISQPWQQHLLDHFFYDAENRMTIEHGMHARGTRNKYLKDLFIQWRGVLAAYDEGSARGDAVLAAAVWRNIFKAKEDVNVRAIAQIVSYIRRVLKGLDKTPDEDIMAAKVEFGSPVEEASLVALKSKMMDTAFEQASPKAVSSGKKA